VESSLCGSIQYAGYFDDVAQTPTSDVQISIPSLEITVLSESFDLVGDHMIKVEGSLTDYSEIDKVNVVTNLEIINPCASPTCLSIDTDSCDQTSIEITLDPYLYTTGDDSLNFTPTIVVNPDQCLPDLIYSCSMPDGPRLDLCEITDGSTISTFNPATGELEL
jgi:hypothetical protein